MSLFLHLPTGVRQALLPRMRARLWIERGIVFIHIPKAAGTSINQALYGQFMGHARARDIERWGSTRVRSLPRFSITRNPWDRLFSAYRYAKRGAGTGDVVAAIWKPDQYRVPEFGSFERFVLEWLQPRDVNRLDFVFRPQWPFVCDDRGRLQVNHLGRVEDLASTIAWVEQVIGPLGSLPWTNKSGDTIDYRSAYTPEMVQTVARIYDRDIRLFGYDF